MQPSLCLCWDGLLIKGQSEVYQRVIKNQPRMVKLSFSPTCPNKGNGTAKFYNYPLLNNRIEGLTRLYEGKGKIDVPCSLLAPVLHELFGPDGGVLFLSLDVDGSKLMVTRTLDFDIVPIYVVMVKIQNTYFPNANYPNVHAIRGHMAMMGKYGLFINFLEASNVYIWYRTVA